MKRSWILIAAVALMAIVHFADFGAGSPTRGEAAKQPRHVPGELLVRYKDENSVRSLNDRLGARVETDFPELRWQHVKLPDNIAMDDAIALYRADPNVENVQPNFIYYLAATPNDEQFGQLYGMLKIAAPQAWDVTTGDPNVVVAVIDTGIDRTHPDLAANVWQNPAEIPSNGVDDDQNGFVDDVSGWDFLNMDNDPADGHDHGTHCSGTIGGVGNNGIGVAGVNWNVKIMPLKTHDDTVGGSTSVSLINTFGYVTMMRNRGVNIRATSNSYGGPPEAGTYDQALKDAIDAAGRAGVLNVFAAGNQLTVNEEEDNDRLPTYPGSYNSPSILTVAASDQNDNRASFSHYGATTVDVAAPGVGILSTVVGGGYARFSGTSMSTPHTAGAAALLAAAHPGLSAASIKATLMNTVDVLPQWLGLTVTGGRINVARAIASPTVCTFNLSSQSASFQVSGGSGSINVSSATNCGFAGYSNQPWVVVTSDPGAGAGSVSYTVLPNFDLAPRTATLNIAGRLFTVTQYGTGPVLPTAAVSGRVLTPDGKGINKAVVTIVDQLGTRRQTTTDAAGNYRFDNLATGRGYTLTAEHKKYDFEQRSVFVIGNAENVDFYGSRN
ncbi:MAG: S8 family serine peptidase [Pyrinomonadaceae bacterium]